MIGSNARAAVLDAFRRQIDWCERLGSPFTARVLTLLHDDIASGGIAAGLVGDWPGDPVADALALRLAGALHALVLRGAAPEQDGVGTPTPSCSSSEGKEAELRGTTHATLLRLARLYPPDARSSEDLGAALVEALAEHRAFVETFLGSPPQTNEVGRAGVLLGGFLTVARETGLRLRTLEIGASAGLNSVWDRFHYRLGGLEWGDPASRVTLAPAWAGPPPPLDTPVGVVERRACDLAPVDLEDAAARLRLSAYVWPDQRERVDRLAGAIAIARAGGLRVERADAAEWLRARLQETRPGVATVLFHSIMWHYMPDATRADIRASLDRAGERAPAGSPLAWLRFEPPEPTAPPELRLTLWPGGRERILATAQAHGNAVTWTDAR